MQINDLLILLKKQFPRINLKDVEQKVNVYKNFLKQQNQIHNLTNLDDEKDIYQKYFYESIINFKNEMLENKQLRVLDIGSGSGIPGIFLKILFPNIRLYIVEANFKKGVFMKQLVNLLKLENTIITIQRCEEYIKLKRNFFDLITCRAVAELRILLEISFPGLKIGGKCFFLKSKNYQTEIKHATLISKKLNIQSQPIIDIIEYDSKTFVALMYVKEHEINQIFPRSWKEILNNDKD